MRNVRFIFFFSILALVLNLPAQNPYIQHYTTAEGLPSNMVYDIYVDSKNFIWFATNAGVTRYDGSHFDYFKKKDGLNSNEVVKIKEDSFGRIWFINKNATFNFFYQNTIFNSKNAPFLDSLKSMEYFSNFFEDEDKTIYFYCNYNREIFALDSLNNVKKYKLPSRVIKYDKDPKFVPYEGMMECFINKHLNGEFYLWTLAGLFRLNTFTKEPTLVSDKFMIAAVFPVSKKYCYANIGYRKASGYEIRKCDYNGNVDPTFPSIAMNSIYNILMLEDSKGDIWIGSYDKGIFCYRNNKLIRHFNIKKVMTIIRDHEDNIWMSSTDGVYKVNPYIKEQIHYERKKFENQEILSLSRHNSNSIWCAGRRTLFLIYNKEVFISNFQIEESSINQQLQINDNILLVGDKFNQQYALKGIRLDLSAKKVYFDKIRVCNLPFWSYSFNRRRNEISASFHHKLFFFNPVRLFRDIKTVDIGQQIHNTFYNVNNDLIVNCKRNYIFKNDSLLACKELSYFNTKVIQDHLNLNDSTEMFNIEWDSLFLLNKKQLLNLTTQFDYPVESPIKHMDYYKSTLVFSTTQNIYFCKNVLNILNHKPIHLRPIDISFSNINDIICNNDTLYIASDNGLTAIPFSTIQEVKIHRPIPYFISVFINDKQTNPDIDRISLKGKNRISFVFGSKSYSSGPVSFSYMLEGADKQWITGSGTNIVYQDLPPGEYSFKLKARKSTSPWSKPIVYHIIIKTTIWRHPLFFISLSIIFLVFIALLIIRRKNLQMKRREIEHQLITLEQKALQSMMNPHFIFNALGSIQNYLLQKKSSEAGLYLSQFARLIRQNLNAINAASINLDEEIDRLKNYLDLEKLRMEDKFEYNIEVDENVEADEIQIPSMIIQPFVENAIWHGIATIQEKGQINVKFRMQDEKSLAVTVEDNGIGIKLSEAYSIKREKHLHIGLEMTRKRLELLGKKFSIKTAIEFFESSPGRPNPGTRVELVVPVGT